MRDYLKDLRDSNGMTQEKLAEAIGISQNYYSCIENGIRQSEIKLSTLTNIAKVFGVPIDKLVSMENAYKSSCSKS